MYFLVNGEEMKACDNYTIEHFHVPSIVLMEHAASVFTEELLKSGCPLEHVGIVCGSGNNGGDGLAVARMLHLAGHDVDVWMVGNMEHATEQTRQQFCMVQSYGIPIHETVEHGSFSKCSVLIDAVFGVGLSRDIAGRYRQVIEEMNTCPAEVVALDIPSGIDAGSGQVLGCAVQASATITFAFCKAGLVLYPGADYAGTVVVRDIGIGTEGFGKTLPELYSYTTPEIRHMLLKRPHRSNKGTYGKTVLVAGSKGMAGAAYLAGIAAYRTGCGLVRIVTPEENRMILQSLLPEAILTTYDSQSPDMDCIREALSWGDCIGIGSGLGLSDTADLLLQEVLNRTNVPVVVDGDALNLLTRHMDMLQSCTNAVITPHLGEMARLVQKSIPDIQKELVRTAQDFAADYPVCCVLKDARTIVTDSREHTYVNLTGNHGMATGGSGDVLFGMLSGFLAGGMERKSAAIAAVHLHGRAGDLAKEKTGARGMTARDIADCIPQALK